MIFLFKKLILCFNYCKKEVSRRLEISDNFCWA